MNLATNKLKKIFCSESKGFSILEMVISIFIIGFILSAFSASLISFRINQYNKNKVLAYNFAQAELEALRNYPFVNLTNRVDSDFIGLAYNLGQQKIVSDALAVSSPQVLSVSPASQALENNISNIVLLPESYYSNFTFSAYLKVLSQSLAGWQTGIIFRYQDVENYYYFSITEDSLDLIKVVGDAATTLYTESQTFSDDIWYNLKVVTLADSIQIYLDEFLVTSLNDDALAQGHLGLMGFNDVYYQIDNIHLESAIQNNDWYFDTEAENSFPQGFLKINPVDLPDSQAKLTIEDYDGMSAIKKITAKVSWQEREELKEIQLSTLRSEPYE